MVGATTAKCHARHPKKAIAHNLDIVNSFFYFSKSKHARELSAVLYALDEPIILARSGVQTS